MGDTKSAVNWAGQGPQLSLNDSSESKSFSVFDRHYQRKTNVLLLPSILMDVVDGCPGVLTLPHPHMLLSLKFVQQWTAGSTAMRSSIKFFFCLYPPGLTLKNKVQFCEHIQEIK